MSKKLLFFAFSIIVFLTSCTKLTAEPTKASIPGAGILPTASPIIEPTTTPLPKPSEVQIQPTPTASIPITNNLTTSILGNGLIWTECVLPDGDYFYTKQDVDSITGCLNMAWPDTETPDPSTYGQRVQGEALDDLRLVIGNDIYEAKGTRVPSTYHYELTKNGAVIASADARFYTFDPNRSLRIIGDQVVWELISEPPVIFVDGENLNEKFHLDGSFFPHSIGNKLIYLAKKGNQYQVIFDGQAIGPKYDEISIAYCCATISVIEGNEQYWFFGKRNGMMIAVAISPPKAVSTKEPLIHDLPGAVYETLFRIPAGKESDIKYEVPSCCANIEGPNAIAVLPDHAILISDLLGGRLLKYDRDGQLQQTISMDELGIGYIRDMRVKGDEIFLLETAYHNFRVHRLTLDGKLMASEEIPYQFPIDAQNPEYTLEGGLTGIAIDCVERIILEVIGVKLFPLDLVQKQCDASLIPQGLLCNGKRFFVSTPSLGKVPQVTAGETIYQTKLSEGLGGLRFLDVFEDGSIYLVREDVMPITPIQVDQTIHYIDAGGDFQRVARVPLSEYYYPIVRNTAVGPDGEVYALLPRPDSLDVIRLNFYEELDPLMPDAVAPEIMTSFSSTGIFDGQPGAYFHAFEASIENQWRGNVNGNQMIVFAGAWVNDPSQGFISDDPIDKVSSCRTSSVIRGKGFI